MSLYSPSLPERRSSACAASSCCGRPARADHMSSHVDAELNEHAGTTAPVATAPPTPQAAEDFVLEVTAESPIDKHNSALPDMKGTWTFFGRKDDAMKLELAVLFDELRIRGLRLANADQQTDQTPAPKRRKGAPSLPSLGGTSFSREKLVEKLVDHDKTQACWGRFIGFGQQCSERGQRHANCDTAKHYCNACLDGLWVPADRVHVVPRAETRANRPFRNNVGGGGFWTNHKTDGKFRSLSTKNLCRNADSIVVWESPRNESSASGSAAASSSALAPVAAPPGPPADGGADAATRPPDVAARLVLSVKSHHHVSVAIKMCVLLAYVGKSRDFQPKLIAAAPEAAPASAGKRRARDSGAPAAAPATAVQVRTSTRRARSGAEVLRDTSTKAVDDVVSLSLPLLKALEVLQDDTNSELYGAWASTTISQLKLFDVIRRSAGASQREAASAASPAAVTTPTASHPPAAAPAAAPTQEASNSSGPVLRSLGAHDEEDVAPAPGFRSLGAYDEEDVAPVQMMRSLAAHNEEGGAGSWRSCTGSLGQQEESSSAGPDEMLAELAERLETLAGARVPAPLQQLHGEFCALYREVFPAA